MKRIHKQPNPLVIQSLHSFILLEKAAGRTPKYKNFREQKDGEVTFVGKDELRQSLLKEQGYICCFCMCRIKDSNETTKIAHIFPQNPVSDEDKQKVKQENLDLNYYNMLAACNGGSGKPLDSQHCDTKQGNTILKINPADSVRNCEILIEYTSSGEIYSNNADINHDLKEVLNLNLNAIKKARKEAYSAIIIKLESKYPNRSWSKRSIENEIKNYSQLKNGKYAPYCQYVIYFLEKKLKQLS
ncbi:MAG: hypothetical protein VKJ02_16190 [Snowella sp.]|nr:hypothetical protein [Snowella sp.]